MAAVCAARLVSTAVLGDSGGVEPPEGAAELEGEAGFSAAPGKAQATTPRPATYSRKVPGPPNAEVVPWTDSASSKVQFYQPDVSSALVRTTP